MGIFAGSVIRDSEDYNLNLYAGILPQVAVISFVIVMISIAVHSSIDNLISTSDKVMKLNWEIRSVLECMNRGIIVVDEESLEVQFENPCSAKLLTGKATDKILVTKSGSENEENVSVVESINIESAQTFGVANSERQLLIKSVPIQYMDKACRMVEIIELPKTE